MTSQPR